MTETRLHLDTVISARRSLPVRGFIVLMAALVTLNLVVGTLFLLIGATPVPIFLGIDVLAVGIAFAVSYRQSRSKERVQVSAEQVRVSREDGRISRTVWSSPTAFTRVGLEQTGQYGAQVRLMLSARRMTIGAALGPQQREDLAEAVDRAIRSARAERYPTA